MLINQLLFLTTSKLRLGEECCWYNPGPSQPPTLTYTVYSTWTLSQQHAGVIIIEANLLAPSMWLLYFQYLVVLGCEYNET